MLLKRCLRLAVACFLLPCALAEEKEPAFTIPDSTLSPDHRYGVSVPTLYLDKNDQDGSNDLIEIATGKVIATLEGDTIFSRSNHETLLPSRWSPDGRLLLWEVDGKWFPWALVLVKMDHGKVTAQYDLLEMAQKRMLAETKKAAPGKYAAAKERNKGNSSAYPDGFSIDVEVLGPIAFPLRLRIALTANPKAIEDHPNLEAAMDATPDAKGGLQVTRFKLERGISRHF